MKFTAITSKTGITAIISLLATGLGMYTGTIPIVAGGQTIVTALLALFLRDAVATNAAAIKQNTQITEAARDEAADGSRAAHHAARTTDTIAAEIATSKGGA